MAKQTASKQPTKKHLARAQREAILRKRLLAAAAVIGAILIVLVAYSLVEQVWILPRTQILTVNGDEYFTLEFQAWVESYYSSNAGSDAVSIGARALEDMIENTLIREEAALRGITVSDEEINTALYQESLILSAYISGGTSVEDLFGGGEEPEQAEIDQAAQEYLQQIERLYGYDPDFYQTMIAISLYEQAIMADLEGDIELVQDHVQLEHILVETEDTALEVKERLDDGEAWEDLVLEYSIDEATLETDGDLGWLSLTDLNTLYGDIAIAIYALDEGDISAPVQALDGWHIFQSLGHEDRELSAEAVQTLVSERWNSILAELKANADIVIAEDWQDYLPDPPVRIQ